MNGSRRGLEKRDSGRGSSTLRWRDGSGVSGLGPRARETARVRGRLDSEPCAESDRERGARSPRGARFQELQNAGFLI